MIKYKTVKKIDKDFLNGYIRHSKTTEMMILENGQLVTKKQTFIENWDDLKLQQISEYLSALIRKGGTVVAVIDDLRTIGFMTIDHKLFGDYVNVPFIHISEEYRGKGYGKKMFYIAAIQALKMGAKKLYISGHPSLDTQMYYQKVGCVLAKEVNQELLAIEPLDIQLEYPLDYTTLMFELVKLEFSKYQRVTALVITKTANTTFKYLPKDDDLFVSIVRKFIQNKTYGYFSVGTLWCKKRPSIIQMKYLPFFEEVMLSDVREWYEVDQFCYRIMNPLIELEESNFTYLDKWSLSTHKDVRRVSLVSMIRTQKSSLKLYYNYEQMIYLVDRLKDDSDFHVKKAVGWVLKCAYPTYPHKVEQYLRDNVSNLDRLIFRYALEHVPTEIRKQLMSLER